jgi:2-polyprenyl-3-methyl-5-hydroxy-6-metoxy-1,4-benzoquinol methylase
MFKDRSYQKEMLDASYISKHLLWQNLKELEFINTYLGGHKITKGALNCLLPILKNKSMVTIADIGCGGGDSLKALHHWFAKNKIEAQIIGIDLKQDCIEYASNNCHKFSNINLRCDDFRNVFDKTQRVDIVHASLFCHHFTEPEIIDFIKICNAQNAIFVINDLERNAIAFYAIQLLTKWFSNSPLVKHDAPLSVRRGFKKKEWKSMLESAQIVNYRLKNKWAFRHQLIIYPNQNEV